MRAALRVALPDVEALAGTAEAIPLPDASADAVLVAQAFHWFDAGAACTEIARVLRPGGVLGLVWNLRDGRCRGSPTSIGCSTGPPTWSPARAI